MENQKNLLASTGLAIGAGLGVSGMIFTSPTIQTCLFVVSGMGLVLGMIVLSFKYFKENQESLGIGFLLFAIGEAIITGGCAADAQTAASTFATGMLFYVVSLWMIFLPKKFPTWLRFIGLAATIPFLGAASRFYLGYGIHSSDMLPGMGYGLLTLTIIGWITFFLKENRAIA